MNERERGIVILGRCGINVGRLNIAFKALVTTAIATASIVDKISHRPPDGFSTDEAKGNKPYFRMNERY